MAFVAQTPLSLVIAGGDHVIVITGQFVAGYSPGIAVLRMGVDQELGFKIPSSGIRKGRYMGPMARQTHNV